MLSPDDLVLNCQAAYRRLALSTLPQDIRHAASLLAASAIHLTGSYPATDAVCQWPPPASQRPETAKRFSGVGGHAAKRHSEAAAEVHQVRQPDLFA